MFILFLKTTDGKSQSHNVIKLIIEKGYLLWWQGNRKQPSKTKVKKIVRMEIL